MIMNEIIEFSITIFEIRSKMYMILTKNFEIWIDIIAICTDTFEG